MPPGRQRRAVGILRDDGDIDVTDVNGNAVGAWPRSMAELGGVDIRERQAIPQLRPEEIEGSGGRGFFDALNAPVSEAPQPAQVATGGGTVPARRAPANPAVTSALAGHRGVFDAPPTDPTTEAVVQSFHRPTDPRVEATIDAWETPTPDLSNEAAEQDAIRAANARPQPVNPATPAGAGLSPEVRASYQQAQPASTPVVAGPPSSSMPPGVRRRGARPASNGDANFDALINDLAAKPDAGGAAAPQLTPLEQAQKRAQRAAGRDQEMADNQQAAARDRQAIAAEAQRAQEERNARQQAAMAAAERQFSDAYQEARREVDPHRLYQNGGGIVIALATALGQLGAGIAGGENTALSIIRRAVDRDIRAQTTNQANLQRQVTNARGFFDITRERFSSEAAAEAAARGLALEQVARRLEAQAAGLQSQAAQDAAAQAVDRLAAEAAASSRQALVAELELRQQDAETRQAEADATRAERRAMGGGGAGRGRAPTTAIMETFNALVDSGVLPEVAAQQLRITVPPNGRFQIGASGQEAGNVDALDTALNRVQSLIPEVGQDIPGFGLFDGMLPDLLAGEQGRELRQAIDSLTELYGRLHSGGAISDDEFALFRRVIGSGHRTENELRNGLDMVRREILSRRGAEGANTAEGVRRR